MDYIPQTLYLTFSNTAYTTGDYAKLFSNGGTETAINWTASHDNRKFNLYDSASTQTAITVSVSITAAGNWMFGLQAYDSMGNASTSTPDEETLYLDLEPYAPDPLIASAYTAATDTLKLTV